MGVKIHGVISKGSKGTLVDIECHLSNNLPTIIIVGFANKAVDEARERIRGAFATSRIMLPRKRITLNLAPADVPKADSGFDLAMAVAILVADGQVTQPVTADQAYIGELGLDGTTRAVRGIIGKILVGRSQGIKTFYIPSGNLAQAQLIPDIVLVPINDLGQLYAYLCMGIEQIMTKTGSGLISTDVDPTGYSLGLSEIVGQDRAKRALEIAAAGGHNVFFSGPPGTGKSMLAKALPSILPPLSREEMLEVTHMHSLASQNYDKIITQRPFRAPHHSASHVAVVGGGTQLRPGEISLAHRGVLFFDEMPEFERDTLEALRQPLEDRVVSLARARETADFPASFILVATANPCPCGYHGSSKDCKCTVTERNRYQSRMSGPILDRIDLQCHVDKVDHNQLLTQNADPSSDNNIRQAVATARQVQAQRFGNSSSLNSDMSNDEVKRMANLIRPAIKVLNQSAIKNNFSARAYFRTIKVARTIADLSGSPAIRPAHIAEALIYRSAPKEAK
jgi:magnesium chelatase family protein